MNTVLTKPSTFYRDMFRLALPIVFQNLITTAVGSADVIIFEKKERAKEVAELEQTAWVGKPNSPLRRFPCEPDYVHSKSGLLWHFLWYRDAGGAVLG